jgi:hypothetical protein
LSMAFSDHASGELSRKAKRLDSKTRHGTLRHAHEKVRFCFFVSSLSFPNLTDGFLGLDIESLSCISFAFWSKQVHLCANALTQHRQEAPAPCRASIVLLMSCPPAHALQWTTLSVLSLLPDHATFSP